MHSISKIKGMVERMIKPWETRIKRESKNPEEEEYLCNITGKSPQNLREVIGDTEAMNMIIEQLKVTHKLNQGKKRKERMEASNKWKKNNEEEADEGRPGRINVDIMGNKKGKVNIVVDHVIENLCILTDEREVHHSLTKSFEKTFARQEQYLSLIHI